MPWESHDRRTAPQIVLAVNLIVTPSTPGKSDVPFETCLRLLPLPWPERVLFLSLWLRGGCCFSIHSSKIWGISLRFLGCFEHVETPQLPPTPRLLTTSFTLHSLCGLPSQWRLLWAQWWLSSAFPLHPAHTPCSPRHREHPSVTVCPCPEGPLYPAAVGALSPTASGSAHGSPPCRCSLIDLCAYIPPAGLIGQSLLNQVLSLFEICVGSLRVLNIAGDQSISDAYNKVLNYTLTTQCKKNVYEKVN